MDLSDYRGNTHQVINGVLAISNRSSAVAKIKSNSHLSLIYRGIDLTAEPLAALLRPLDRIARR
jgi:hypothetical protein